jgi:hypothetical protein
MKIKVTELKGKALNWAVTQVKVQSRGWHESFLVPETFNSYHDTGETRFTQSWRLCGRLIDLYEMSLIRTTDWSGMPKGWRAGPFGDDMLEGDTPLEAVCRAAVAMHHKSKTVEIDIPEDLLK